MQMAGRPSVSALEGRRMRKGGAVMARCWNPHRLDEPLAATTRPIEIFDGWLASLLSRRLGAAVFATRRRGR